MPKPLKPEYAPTLAERAYLSQYEEGIRHVMLLRLRREPDMLPDVALVAEIQRSIDEAVREAKG